MRGEFSVKYNGGSGKTFTPGRADALFRSSETGELILVDWKHIVRLGEWAESYAQYELQLNLYAYILSKSERVSVPNLYIVYINETGFFEKKVKVLSAEYLERVLESNDEVASRHNRSSTAVTDAATDAARARAFSSRAYPHTCALSERTTSRHFVPSLSTTAPTTTTPTAPATPDAKRARTSGRGEPAGGSPCAVQASHVSPLDSNAPPHRQ